MTTSKSLGQHLAVGTPELGAVGVHGQLLARVMRSAKAMAGSTTGRPWTAMAASTSAGLWRKDSTPPMCACVPQASSSRK